MASKKKDTGKKGDLAKTQTLIAEDFEPTMRDLISEEQMTSWQVTDTMIEVLLDSTMNVMKNKELAAKVPMFSLVSTMQLFDKAMNMKDL